MHFFGIVFVVVLWFAILSLCDKAYQPGKFFETFPACGDKDKDCACGEYGNISCGPGFYCAIIKGYREPRR